MTQTYRVLCLSEATSPLTHMMGVAGNESLVAREPVVSDRGIVWVPVLSGNQIRHRLIREPGVRYLVEQYELGGKLTLAQLNFLFHGGNLTESNASENTARIAAMQRLFPLLRLVGGSLPNQILSGSLLVSRGLLVCEENRSALLAMMPDSWELPKESLRSAEHFVSGYQYTRGEAVKTVSDLLPEVNGNGRGDNQDGKSNLMIFSGQAVTRGACFIHDFTLQHVSELELGALLWSLRLWQANGGTIGGQGARGHGRLQTMLCRDDDGDEAIEAYRTHVDGVKDDAVAWLDDCFKPREAKKKKTTATA